MRTEFVPPHDVLLTDSNPHIDDRALTMHGLGQRTQEDMVAALTRLLQGYQEWTEAREEEASALAGTPHEAAARQPELCRLALGRIRRGVA
ncbi:hypothetical protein [Streptomyces sp. NPDC054842]